MKRTFTRIALALCIPVWLTSCDKEPVTVSTESLEVKLRAGECYSYDLGTFDSDETAIVTGVPKRADSSVLRRNATGDRMIYRYCPIPVFIGTDDVVITSTRKSAPGTMVTTLRFTMSK